MSSKYRKCQSCKEWFSESMDTCPSCGKGIDEGVFSKLKASFLSFLVWVVGLVLTVALFSTSEEKQPESIALQLEVIENSQSVDISSSGELSEIFSIVSGYTNVQRENSEEYLKGKIVQWTLPVYDVSKKKENIYKVLTRSESGSVGTYVTLYARSAQDVALVEGLMTDDAVTIKGKVKEVKLRTIIIDPAILIANY